MTTPYYYNTHTPKYKEYYNGVANADNIALRGLPTHRLFISTAVTLSVSQLLRHAWGDNQPIHSISPYFLHLQCKQNLPCVKVKFCHVKH